MNYRTITGAYDPNDKLATTSSGSTRQWLLGEDEWVDYTIRFQNTGTDTAFHVLITDTLPANLDPGSLEMGAASHNFTWQLRDVGTLKFYFMDILLPDSNVDEPRSHGFVGFRIRPRLPLLAGTTVENIANIHFDFNQPVITEPSVLVAEFSTGISDLLRDVIIYPNPARTSIEIQGVQEAHWSIHSMDGRAIAEGRMNGNAQVDVTSLCDGPYLIQLITENGAFTLPFQKLANL